jgi:predicted O-linked N-acetylglucosamine transferase (SPINDLY family)
MHYCEGITQHELSAAHDAFNRWVPAVAGGFGRRKHRATQDRLRLGFVSPDLGPHPVGRFLIRVLESLRPLACETVCYSDRIAEDDFTRRFRSAADRWHDTNDWSDDRLSERIRGDAIDILFDLAGHTAGNRLLVFARKPVPVQITWLGYVGTTGLSAMDYILADRFQLPQKTEDAYRERVLRMPDGYVCYDPPATAPPIAPPPVLSRGFFTFGSFNNPAKIGPSVVELWARILRRIPTARLRLQFRGLSEPEMRHRFSDAFASHGIDSPRVALGGELPHGELLGAYGGVDAALDPFPYNGGLTTCEALWMGVPVITCPGETFASRHGLSHLSNVGLTETIARDLDDYVAIAVRLANDLPRLAAIRAGLRSQMAASPLCDGPRFAANLMGLLREVWRRWCEGAEKDDG